MRADVQHQEQTSVRSAIDSWPALPIQTDLRTSIHTRWDLHLLLNIFALQASALTGLTRGGYYFAATVTGRAGRGLNHLTEKSLAHLTYFTLSVTSGTTRRGGSRLCP